MSLIINTENNNALMSELINLYKMRISHIKVIELPLILITQLPRSGGTLMSQLLDGHPQIYAHPLELHIGYPNRNHWPSLDLESSPELWFDCLYEKPFTELSKEGYFKGPKRLLNKNEKAKPFIFLPFIQKQIFLSKCMEKKPTDQREILDIYFTSFFNAWIDYQDLYMPDKKYVSGFVPQLSDDFDQFSDLCQQDLDSYFFDYPDGKYISLLRNPKSWYLSAKRFSEGANNQRVKNMTPTIEQGVKMWKKAVQLSITNYQEYQGKVFLMNFENLIKNPKKHMVALAHFLQIEYNNCLINPTFQMMNIKAHSTSKIDKYGIIKSTINRGQELSVAEAKYIDSETNELYKLALSLASDG